MLITGTHSHVFVFMHLNTKVFTLIRWYIPCTGLKHSSHG